MDKENKYYNLIENLIKNHTKFPGYEAILEDIIDDVYAHSEVIINSIDNESVINSYLEKIITTSLITVPKRMNLNNNVRHRVIQTPSQILNKPEPDSVSAVESEQADISNQDLDVQKANPEFVDKMINSINNDNNELFEQEKESDDILSEIDSVITEEDLEDSIELTEENFENINESDLSEDITEIEDISADYESSDIDINSEKLDTEEPVDDDFSLQAEESIEELEPNVQLQSDENESIVDVITPDEELLLVEPDSDDNVIIESEEQENLSEASGELLNFEDNESSVSEKNTVIETIEEDSLPFDNNNEDIDTEDLVQEESTFDNIYDSVYESEDVQTTFDNIDENQNITEDIEEDTIDILPEVNDDSSFEELTENSEDEINIDNSMEDINILTDNYDFHQSDENELENIAENSDFISETDSIELSINDENSSISQEIEISDNDSAIDNDVDFDLAAEFVNNQKEKSEDINFKPIDYSAFDYTPNRNSISEKIDVVTEKLAQLNNENPELEILKIFDLKYKQKLSINEIASELNVKEQDVIDILNKLIELV